MRRIAPMSLAVTLAAVAAACSTAPRVPSTSVRFVLNAPLCSTEFPMEFSIDGAVVGTDTFRVDLPNPHVTSRRFAVDAGRHVLGARVPKTGLSWPDTSVAVAAGAMVDDSLPLYCS